MHSATKVRIALGSLDAVVVMRTTIAKADAGVTETILRVH